MQQSGGFRLQIIRLAEQPGPLSGGVFILPQSGQGCGQIRPQPDDKGLLAQQLPLLLMENRTAAGGQHRVPPRNQLRQQLPLLLAEMRPAMTFHCFGDRTAHPFR